METSQNDDTLRIVNEILSDHRDDKVARFKRKYPGFAGTYPTLLTMCCSARTDEQRTRVRGILTHMLTQLSGLDTGRVSGQDASRSVADELNRVYIEPLLEKQAPNNVTHDAYSGGDI
jgi:hypothetical protein